MKKLNKYNFKDDKYENKEKNLFKEEIKK